MESINTKEELSRYNLEGKWNDYVGVQKEVLRVLREENYFENSDIINTETGMVIRLTARGIKETIGNGNRFQYLPKNVKIQKVVTVNSLPNLIREAKLLKDEVINYYSDGGDRFAYFINKVFIDEQQYNVRIAVKKKVGANHFYIHHIDTEKSSELLSPSQKTVDYEIQNS